MKAIKPVSVVTHFASMNLQITCSYQHDDALLSFIQTKKLCV